MFRAVSPVEVYERTLRFDFASSLKFRSAVFPVSPSSILSSISSSVVSCVEGSRDRGESWIPRPSILERERICLKPFAGRVLSVGAVLLLESDAWVSWEAEDREVDEREENDTVDEGGDWGGKGICAGSTLRGEGLM